LLAALAGCIDHDPGIDPMTPGGTATTGDGEPCDVPGEAQLIVEGRSYTIMCGCAEVDGRRCTVPVGTRVVWTFAASESHTVTSAAAESGDQLSGRFEQTFDEPGTFPYGCSIHAEMSGYEIEVED
jgi:hypothetical protein